MSDITVLVYETPQGLAISKCHPNAFLKLSRTLRQTVIDTPNGSVFVKYPRWIPVKDVSQLVQARISELEREQCQT